MSANFCLAVIGAPFKKLWVSVIFALCCMQKQQIFSCNYSMRLRPKRTCSGVVCFGGFHINRFLHLILLLRNFPV
ncbi:hypothetical protein P3L10_031358 [Capsicum annuum]